MLYNYCLITTLALIVITHTFYTNSEALECFNTKAIAECATKMSICLADSACSEELKKYNKCSFGSSEEEGSHIFNGYCFRRWEENAVHSKNLIDCFRKQCNLDYNSQIGVKQLFMCAQWTMFDNHFDCGEACETQMQKLGKNLYSVPLAQLYRGPFEDKEAQHVANLIRQSCIEQGEGKRMIYEEQEEKYNKRFNKKQNQQNKTETQL